MSPSSFKGILHKLPTEALDIAIPSKFTFPFCYEAHPLCKIAAKEVIKHCYSSKEMYPKEGKMFGVLVVKNNKNDSPTTTSEILYYIAAFSGIYNGEYNHDGFVPTIYNLQDENGYFHEEEKRIDAITQEINSCKDEQIKTQLKTLRKEKSHNLQMWTFRQFRMLNALGEEKDLTEIFKDFKAPYTKEEYNAYKTGKTNQKPKSKIGIPPGGAGECCAPKLLQYAYQNNLTPICMAEFWIGPSPKDEMRTEGYYYPACQHKCKPILSHMLIGLNVEENPMVRINREMINKVSTLYEDSHILVVYKPAGLMSVPGKEEHISLLSHIQETHPDAMLPHRLDMDTSGIMLVALNEEVYKTIQAMFFRHEIKKTYVAILEDTTLEQDKKTVYCNLGTLTSNENNSNNNVFQDIDTTNQKYIKKEGIISLPLSPNAFDRPRQMVNHEHGKTAITTYKFIDDNKVMLMPETGRTHQLRVHCASKEGIGRPIKGDKLYGQPADRLYLHAEKLEFSHPITGEFMQFEKKEI